MKKVIIDRAKWSRVKADGTKHMFNPENEGLPNNALATQCGGRCCLGFLAEQLLGEELDWRRAKSRPLSEDLIRAGLASLNVEMCIHLNDGNCGHKFDSDAEQEAAIASVFAAAGIEVEFNN